MPGVECAPTEGVIHDVDVLDRELENVELEIGEKRDAIFKDSACTSPRRRFLMYGSIVAVCLIGIIVTLSTTLTKRSRVQGLEKHDKDYGVKHPEGDIDSHFYICLASSSMCTANSTQGDWTQAGNDISGEGSGDLSGRAMALSCDGRYLAVGAPRNTNDTGHARVYSMDEVTMVWRQVGGDIDGIAEKDQAGSAVAVSADGRRVAVGAGLHDGNGDNSGHVRVLDFDGQDWNLVGQEIFGEGAGDASGKAISLSASGHRLAIGGSSNNATGTNAGHVRVYEYSQQTRLWEQLGSDLDGHNAGDFFGKSVALSSDGRRVAIGGHKSDGRYFLTDVGHVMVFEYINGVWEQVGNEIKGITMNAWFGHTVSLNEDGSILAVGAPGDSGFLPGETPVFELVDGGWRLMGKPLWGGYAVDLSTSGKRVVSASPYGAANGGSSGSAIVYDYNGTDWITVGEKMSGLPNDLSGTSVAISGDGMRTASASPGADFFSQENVGFVRVFDYC